jgi:DNA polymerase-3 subunit gamma/tau
MSQYVVSARKYRPQIFGEVVGQQQVTDTLKNALKSNHLAQSFLFCGPRGVGKTTCARILAKAINCEQPADDMEPCNSCASCESFNAHTSFNIHELDAASNNSVDDMRALTDQVRFTPQAGKYKVYIIDEVHMLSQAAFNAFLKTLEEPPPYAVFILATTEKHKIIPTILSRCQIFDFKRIGVKDIVGHLQHICSRESVQAEDNALHVIAQKADGALRDALSIFDKVASFSGDTITYDDVVKNLNILDYEYFFTITEQLVIEDSTALLLSFNDILSRGFEGDTLMLGLAEHFRNLLMCKDEATLPLLEVSTDVAERYRHQAGLVDDSFLLNALDLASQCDVGYKMARNKRLHVELTLLKICFLNSVLETAALPVKKKQASPSEPVKKPAKKTLPEPAVESPSQAPVKAERAEEQPAEQIAEQGPSTAAVIQEAGDASPVETMGSAPIADDGTDEVEPEVETAGREAPENGSASLNLMQELEQAVSGKSFKIEQKEEEENDAPPLTGEKVLEAWQHFLVSNAPDLPSNFLSNAKELQPSLREGKEITLVTNSSVSRGFIVEQSSLIKTYMRDYFQQSDIQFRVDLVVDESDDQQPKSYLKPEEQFREMAKDNPSLIDFQKRFDLDIEY